MCQLLASSRGQFLDRTEYRLAEIIHPSAIQPPIESLTYFTASQREIEVILIVGHRVLDEVSERVCLRTVGGNVLES